MSDTQSGMYLGHYPVGFRFAEASEPQLVIGPSVQDLADQSVRQRTLLDLMGKLSIVRQLSFIEVFNEGESPVGFLATYNAERKTISYGIIRGLYIHRG